MGIKFIRPKEGIKRQISDSYSVLNLLTSKDSDNISLSISKADNHKETTKTTSDRIYYILKGKLVVNDDLIVRKWEVIFIPANTEYSFKWTFKAILLNSPPFKKKNESISKLW